MPRSWLLVLLLAAPGAAAVVEKKDLSATFPGPATRDQGPTGTCHIFTTVSLVESALFRRYGWHLALSEADLFVGKIIGDKEYYAQVKKSVGASQGTTAAWKLLESGTASEDIEWVKSHGLASAATAPWAEFEKRYQEFRVSRKEQIAAQAQRVEMFAGALADVRLDRARPAPPGSDYFASLRSQQLRGVEMKIAGGYFAARKDFFAYLDGIVLLDEYVASPKLLGAPQAALAKERRAIKALVAPFTLRKDYMREAPVADRGDAARCRAAGKPQLAAVLGYLRRGIPVTIDMDIEGLKAWTSSATKERSWHAFTVVGFERDDKAGVTLKSRNSWGGDNPSVAEDQLCRVRKVTALLTDRE